MSGYIPPYHITDEILLHVAAISEKIGALSARPLTSDKPHLRKNTQIHSIYSSLRIEANSLSLNDVRDVIEGRLVLGPQREIQEVKNAYSAYEQLAATNPFDLNELCRLHAVMTHYLVDESGTFRRGEEGVFEGDKCIFVAPPAKRVPLLMHDLFDWMNNARETVHPLIMATVFHYEFVFIHPFVDGNGRMARLWHTALLYKWNPIFEFIPLESQIEKCQAAYYQAIADCHKAGESTIFITFILSELERLINELLAKQEADDTQSGTQFDTQNDSTHLPLSERIVYAIRANNRITRQALADQLGVSKSTITRALRALDNIHWVGPSKTGLWEEK